MIKNFKLSKLKSKGKGIFDIYISNDNKTIYKKIRNVKSIKDLNTYKKVLEKLSSIEIINKYIYKYDNIKIESDGSYFSSYIKNGIKLNEIDFQKNINFLIIIKNEINKLKIDLEKYSKKNKLIGDWTLDNLLFNIDDLKIYNIDYEGFYTYGYQKKNSEYLSCNIDYVKNMLNDLFIKIDNFVNKNYFTLILWNPISNQFYNILNEINNVIDYKEFIIPNENLHNFIFDIYKLDKRCNQKIVLPNKIEKLKKYYENHLIIKFKVQNPTFNKKNICTQVLKLKEKIRNKYNKFINNYERGLIIHICDDIEQSKYTWEKINYLKKDDDIIIQNSNDNRIKITKKDTKKGWKTIDKLKIKYYKSDNDKLYYVYKKINPVIYYLSNKIILSNDFYFRFNFFLNSNKIPNYISVKNIITHKNIITNKNIITHKDCYNYVLDSLNENKIEFIIIRGFKFLPDKPDTDLDIVINNNHYNKFLEVMDGIIKLNLLRKNEVKIFYKNKNKFFYNSYFTSYDLEDNDHLPGKYYRFDIYNDLFFYLDGEKKSTNAFVPNILFKRKMFENKIRINNYFIPDPSSEIILLIYRNVYDKRNKWSNKHKLRINELITKINLSNFNNLIRLCFKNYKNFYTNLNNNIFSKNDTTTQKINLFIIRKKGLKPKIINNVISKIKKEFEILDDIFITINNNKKFYKKFYNNFDKYEENILDSNDNQCLAIITILPDNKNPNNLKEIIRSEYLDYYPPKGNIIHSSDSHEDCEKELELLLNENIGDLKNIGNYYSSLDV